MTEKDEVREHSFDGIQEYDNDLPQWWVWLFIITVVISVIYPFVYDFGPLDFDSQTIDQEMVKLKAQQGAAQANAPISEETLVALTKSPDALRDGQETFKSRCMPCHGDKGQGLIGPNLADDYWIHGGKITDLHLIVENGVLEKGMLAWKAQLTPSQLNNVVAFIWTLNGTNPPNPKAPQGELVARKN